MVTVGDDKYNTSIAIQKQKSQPTPTYNPDLVDFNTADVETLAKLPGMTLELSNAVVDYRNEHGNFIKRNDIVKVQGITMSIYAQFYHYILTVNPDSDKMP